MKMYVDAIRTMELIECMETANTNNLVLETLQEVKEIILDDKWIEVEDE